MSSRTTSGTKSPQLKGKDERSSIWTILGESSMVLAIVSAVLFMIGWTYESNWYTYFGVSTMQIDIPLPQILIRSLPIIVISLFIIFLVYSLVSLSAKIQEWLSRPQISEPIRLKLISVIAPICIYVYSLWKFHFFNTNDIFSAIRLLSVDGIIVSVIIVLCLITLHI